MFSYHLRVFFFLALAMSAQFNFLRADNIYIMNAPGYNTAYADMITAMTNLGHTVTVNSTDFDFLPNAFTSACIDPVNGYHWLCFFGEYDFSSLAPDVLSFIADGGKVYYNYEVSCCTNSSAGAAAMVSAITGLAVTPSPIEYIALDGGANGGWESTLDGCITFTGNAYKCLDGLPVANQLQATALLPGASPDITDGLNFGYFFTGADIPGNTLGGSITGMGDINSWYDGAEPGAAPVNTELVEYFFPTETSTCHLATTGCSQLCPFENVLGADASFCNGASLTLDATSQNATYLWHDNSTGPTVQVNQAGTYWVEVSDGTETCRDSIEVSVVTVNVQAATDLFTCPGLSVQLQAAGADTYSWSPAATLNNSGIQSPQATPLITTTYTVTGTMDGCTDIDEIIVNVVPFAVDYEMTMTPEICDTQGSFLISNVSGNEAPYLFELNNVAINENEVIPLSSATYQLIVTNSLGCLEISDIIIEDNSTVVSWSTTSTNPRCASLGEIIVTDINGGTAPYDVTLNNLPQLENTFQNLNAGNFTIEISDVNGCTNSETTTLIAGINDISATIETFPAICETPGSVTSVNVSDALGIFFITIDGNLYPGGNFPIDTTLHELIVTDEDFCTYSQTFSIENINPTQAIFTADPYLTHAPADVIFTNTSMNSTSWLWDFGNGITSENMDEVQRYLEPGNYNVVLTAIDDVNGCTDTMLYIIYVMPPNSIYVPNTFTPDADGINDVFQIKGENISEKDFSLSIFNRWGEPVWISNSPDKSWTGSFNDGSYFIPDGVYPFLLKYKFHDSVNQLSLSGHIQIIR